MWSSFCLTVITLCPATSSLQLHISPCYRCIQFPFAPYVQHTLHTVLQGNYLIPPNHEQFFSSLCILKSPDSLSGGSSLGPLGVVRLSGPSFSLQVITLCPPTAYPQPSTSLCYRYNPIPPHTPFSPALHILLFSPVCMPYISGDPTVDHGPMNDSSCFGLYTDINFCTQYSNRTNCE